MVEELTAWIGRENTHDGADEVSRNDIRRKLEVFCYDCPLYTDDATARAHGYRMAFAPWALVPLWSLPPYWQPGEPPLWGPGRTEKTGGHTLPIPSPWKNTVNASSEVTYYEPVYPGDRLRTVQKLVEIKNGRHIEITALDVRTAENGGEGLFLSQNSLAKRQFNYLATVVEDQQTYSDLRNLRAMSA